MVLEDVDFLQSHSTKKSYMFYIDSQTRNKRMYPNPNEYAITFSAPFRNVYSLEILDASIPRTQYAIDLHNNKFVYKYKDEAETTLILPIGDYNDKNLIIAMNTAFAEKNHDIEIDNISIPADERSTFVFRSTETFILNMYDSTISSTLGFDLLSEGNNRDEFDNLLYKLITNLSEYDSNLSMDIETEREFRSRLFGSVLGSDYRFLTVFEGPSASSMFINLSDQNDAIGQTFTINNDQIFDSIELYFNDSYENTFGVAFYVDNNGKWVAENYLSLTDDSNSFTKLATESKKILNIADSRPVITGCPITYLFVLYLVNSVSNTANIAIEQSSSSAHTSQSLYHIKWKSNLSLLDSEVENRTLCCTIKTKIQLQEVTAPGIYSLVGDRYVLLRCPEIEQHMFASHSYEKYSLGLAKFKLAVLGYDESRYYESRFDFASIPPREFHPIGKLTQMTFSFQRSNGSLYNFRGMNHTITMAIRYLVPFQNVPFKEFSLNPNYNPDFFQYQQQLESDDSESD